MQSVVTGRARSRSIPISPPHSSHWPYEPSSIRATASLTLVSSLRSRSRIRSRKLRSDSSAARSVGSAQASSDSLFMVSTARSDSWRMSRLRPSSNFLKSWRSLCLTVELSVTNRVFDSIDALLPCKGCAMKTAYLDAFSGLSGDMLVGAILDCGADFGEFERAIKSMPLAGYRLSTRRKTLSGISALKFDVAVTELQPERHVGEIRALIDSSQLAATVRSRAISIFEVLAQAEAKIHNTTPDRVHFHEVGAVDSIIDIVGTAWGLEQLGVGDVIVSPLPMGNGFARSQHGVIPVPAPATVELLSGFPLKIGDGAHEMVTPTGAAVIRALARPAAIPLAFEVEKIGYGAGSRELEDRPNVLRLMLGRERAVLDSDEMIEISANIDDLSPQIYDHLMNRLFEAGARDVTLTPTMMKKSRPAVTLGVIAEAASREAIAEIIFAETSTIGLRFHAVARLKLRREIQEVDTRWGKVRVKISGAHGRERATISPEYDDCRRIATEHKVALRIVMEEAREAARSRAGEK